MGSRKNKDKDREHRRKHKHTSSHDRDRSKSKEKRHRKKSRTQNEKEERKARKKAAAAHLEDRSKDDRGSLIVTEIDYGHGLQIQDLDDVHRYTTNTSSANEYYESKDDKKNKKDQPTEGKDGKYKDDDDIHVPAINIGEKRRTEKIKERTETIRHKREYEEKLSKIRGLGDSDSDDDGAFAWVKRSRIIQREKELAAKREKILDDMDAEFGLDDLVSEEFSTHKDKTKAYTQKDLQGLTVQHTLDRFTEGKSTILTLDDKRILDDDGDVLVNVNIADDERVDKDNENKKKRPFYNPYADSEVDEFGMHKSAGVLSKYNEEIDGTKKESFKLGTKGRYDDSKERAIAQIKLELRNQRQSLSLNPQQLASEYYTVDEMNAKFKKTKRKKRKIRGMKDMIAVELTPMDEEFGHHHGSRSRGRGLNPILDDIPGLENTIKQETIDTVASEQTVDDNNQDDSNQAAYTYYSVSGQEAWPGQEPEFVKLEPLPEDMPDDSDYDIGPSEDLSGVVLDPDEAESELRTVLDLTRRLKQKTQKENPGKRILKHMTGMRHDVEMDSDDIKNAIVLNSTSEFCRSLGDIPTYGQSGNREEDEEIQVEIENEEKELQEMEEEMMTGWNEVDIDTKPVDIAIEEDNILDDEPIINKGLCTALSLAVRKGFLENEVMKTISSQSKIQAENYSIEDKRYEDLDEKSRKRDRYVGALSDFKEKVGYRPDIKLEYVDDKGNMLNHKEAFRYLSHRFHGKGSGKKKTEKRDKKVEDELLMKQMSSIDTPLGTLSLLKEKQKSEKSPYVILTGVSSNKAFMANTITK